MPNRRIRKRLHRWLLDDVLYGVSLSYVWRAHIFEAGLGTELLVNGDTLDNLPTQVVAQVRRWGLRYVVSWVPHAWTSGYPEYQDYIMFSLRAEEFPQIMDFSANNPETVYGRPRLAPEQH